MSVIKFKSAYVASTKSLILLALASFLIACLDNTSEVMDNRAQFTGLYKGTITVLKSGVSINDTIEFNLLEAPNRPIGGIDLDYNTGTPLMAYLDQSTITVQASTIIIQQERYGVAGKGRISQNKMEFELSGFTSGVQRIPVIMNFTGVKRK